MGIECHARLRRCWGCFSCLVRVFGAFSSFFLLNHFFAVKFVVYANRIGDYSYAHTDYLAMVASSFLAVI